mmetsp:Transcript_13166/g.27235  ORF Transcript_13166/g.27235 Transcript_13166/m.27235 type:complete len:146 (-) Transcript_13166:199-636(-)
MANQWMYEMINVIDVWREGYTGEGVTIRINDDGVDIDNEEFVDRFDDVTNSCNEYLPNDPTSDNDHGTIVAGIILGNADNGHCAVGIAYKAKFSSCDVFNNPLSRAEILEYKIDTFDISQNSWGPLYVTTIAKNLTTVQMMTVSH